jgi:hypothetical protein
LPRGKTSTWGGTSISIVLSLIHQKDGMATANSRRFTRSGSVRVSGGERILPPSKSTPPSAAARAGGRFFQGLSIDRLDGIHRQARLSSPPSVIPMPAGVPLGGILATTNCIRPDQLPERRGAG